MVDKELKKMIEDELNFFSKISQKEYMLFRKLDEINHKYPKHVNNANSFFNFSENPLYPRLNIVKDKIWIPKHPDDYLELDIDLVYADENKQLKQDWNILRDLAHTGLNNGHMGRGMLFIPIDKKTGKYLGMIAISSDFLAVGGREKYIGWTKDNENARLDHIANGSTIAPTQPFGFNYLGGKLLALLCCSDIVQYHWKRKYKDPLVGITTTSLYGGYSQYTNLKYWKKCESSEGKTLPEHTKKTVSEINKWLLKNHYEVATKKCLFAKDYRMKFVYKTLGIKQEYSAHRRGVYFCRLYEDTLPYLRQETEDPGKKRFDNSVKTLSNIWKEKYASKRIKKLVENNNISDQILFYNDLIGASFNEVKKLYPEI